MSPEVAAAVAHALAIERGLEVSAPAVLADRSNLVLGLGAGVVARVAMATSLARVGMAWLRREVEVSRFLDAEGVGVTRPIDGPFERDGFVISFWHREAVASEGPDPATAGAELRRAHAALARYEGALPEWGGFEEARLVRDRARTSRMMTAAELARVDRAWEAAERVVHGARARSASFQAVHGDAHIRNVLATARGILWTDWEDAFRGPIEFDLACLRSRAELLGEEVDAIDAMTSAYGEHDRDLVRDLGPVRNLQVIVWLAVFAERDPSLLPRMRARIERLP
ncbi:MAG: aminoglycoside phosphotransferase family protein [Labilithrix sp.]|nr:aminoglycoside phosphotransferase family protein [Labilithrix sp.]MCW5810302.1 aminoglycoside phosphotransferase family protein [Labilithrix sp.]